MHLRVYASILIYCNDFAKFSGLPDATVETVLMCFPSEHLWLSFAALENQYFPAKE